MLMGILSIPDNIDVETLKLFMKRTHQTHLGARLGSACVAAIVLLFVLGRSFAVPIVLWMALTAWCEFVMTRTIRQHEINLQQPTPQIIRDTTRSLFYLTGLLTAVYSSLGLLLTLGPMPGPVFAALFSAAALMNISSQHVLHSRMILWSIPFPAITLLMAGYQLGGLALVVMALILVQAVSLTKAAVDSYATLTTALALAKAQSEARIEADAANTAKSLFLATMSHELRTPLTAIIGYSELMREDAGLDNRDVDVRDHDKVLMSAKRLLRQINDVLDVSKIEAGSMVCETLTFDVADEIITACDTIGPATEVNGNKIVIDLDPSLQFIRSDAFKFGQCALNLLSNANKFTKDGTITVKLWQGTKTQRDMVFVSVTDTGIGMTPAQAGSLFRAFTQADATITRRFGGTGLGLALSRSLARLLGGDIAVTSCLGSGSCFTLSIKPEAIFPVVRDNIDLPIMHNLTDVDPLAKQYRAA